MFAMAACRCSVLSASAEGSLNSCGCVLPGAGVGVVGASVVEVELWAGAAGVCKVAGAGVEGAAADEDEAAVTAALG